MTEHMFEDWEVSNRPWLDSVGIASWLICTHAQDESR